jgi:hypothetical protein
MPLSKKWLGLAMGICFAACAERYLRSASQLASKACTKDVDCDLSEVCISGACVVGAQSCTDGEISGSETGIDCGGGACPACGAGSVCAKGSDCVSQNCLAGLCADASCSDGLKNAEETAVDCGGGSCGTCGEGDACLHNSDCSSNICMNGSCSVPTCLNGRQDIDETDVDCGGRCSAKCTIGQACTAEEGCAEGLCDEGRCIACRTDSDCAASNACRSVKCVAKVCETTLLLEEGELLPTKDQKAVPGDCKYESCGNQGEIVVTFVATDLTQTPGDCRNAVCDEAKVAPVSVDNPADLPPSDSKCVVPACEATDGHLSPVLQKRPEGYDTGRDSLRYCDGNGKAVQCTQASQCPNGSNATCNGNACGCTQSSAQQACGSRQCGGVPNGCGAMHICGTCAANAQCNVNGFCQCVPLSQTTACGGRQCGTAPDGCGASYSCGTCSGCDTCNAHQQCERRTDLACPTQCSYRGGTYCGMSCPDRSCKNSLFPMCCSNGKCSTSLGCQNSE